MISASHKLEQLGGRDKNQKPNADLKFFPKMPSWTLSQRFYVLFSPIRFFFLFKFKMLSMRQQLKAKNLLERILKIKIWKPLLHLKYFLLNFWHNCQGSLREQKLIFWICLFELNINLHLWDYFNTAE